MASYDRNKVIPATDIGPGWTFIEVPRANKAHGRSDKYWFSPVKHHRFRSKAEVNRYKAALEAAPGGDEDKAWDIFKGKPTGGGKCAPKSKGSATKKRKKGTGGSGASAGSPTAATAISPKKKKKKKSRAPSSSKDNGDERMVGGDVAMSAADAGAGAGAGHAKKKKSSSPVKSRKSRGSSNKSSTRGYLPNVDPNSTTKDGPYVDEDEITRVYNFPKGNIPDDEPMRPELKVDGDKTLEGIDEGGTPYRHITNWFLAKPGVDRMELPSTYRSIKNVCLYGELLPSPKKVNKAILKGKEPPEYLPVVIRRPMLWSIDRDHADRGIWFATKDAWYKLEQPCTAKVLKDKNTGEMLSQEDLHLKLRAKFGLVSNLLDMFNESSVELNLESFFGLHSCRSPNESHSLLSPSKVLLEEYPELLEEPFDLDLLRREAKFVREHLDGCHEDFNKSCNFVKGLMAMEREREVSADEEEDTFDYLASAEAAEKRGGRLPWGCLGGGRQQGTGPRINRLVEIKVQRSKSPPPKKSKSYIDAEKGGGKSPEEKKSSKVASSNARSQVAPTKQLEPRKIKVSAKASASIPQGKEPKSSPRGSSRPRGSPRGSPRQKLGSMSTKRKHSESDDSMFHSDSAEDEWQPSGKDKVDALRAAATGREVEFSVLDAQLYPILIDCVKRKHSNKIKPFLDSAARVLEKRADAFITSCITTDTVESYEYMLVVVECLRVSSVAVLQQLFDKKNPKSAGCRSIFLYWLNAARERMEARRSTEEERCILEAVQSSAKTEEELAIAILRLARTCFDSKTGIYPDDVKNTFGVNLIKIVKELKEFSQLHGLEKLTNACSAATSHLKTPKRGQSSHSSDASDPFGQALERESPSRAPAPAPTAEGTAKANDIRHSSDSASFKAVGKAAAAMAMANYKKSSGSDRNLQKSGSSRSVGSDKGSSKPLATIGDMLASEMRAASSKSKPGSSATGIAYARSMPKNDFGGKSGDL